MVTRIKDAKNKLGEERIEEIVDKEWKTADLPSEEELSKEQPKNPKARNNINSRKNLVQYRKKKDKETKKKILSNLKYKETEEDIDPRDILDPEIDIEMLEKLVPAREILSSRREQELYYSTVNLFMKDFSFDELTASDIDDILSLAKNKVMEYRIMKVAAGHDASAILDAAPTLEKIGKTIEKLKSGLANRRVDRIDTKNKPKLSIVDLAHKLDEEDKADFERRIKDLEKQQQDYTKPKRLNGEEE